MGFRSDSVSLTHLESLSNRRSIVARTGAHSRGRSCSSLERSCADWVGVVRSAVGIARTSDDIWFLRFWVSLINETAGCDDSVTGREARLPTVVEPSCVRATRLSASILPRYSEGLDTCASAVYVRMLI